MANKKDSIRISEEQICLFHEGTNHRSYQILGAHIMKQGGNEGTRFCVWAPHADMVSVVGDFNGWNTQEHPMKRRDDSGLWELFLPQLGKGQLYQYAIRTSNGELLYKADPFAYYAEVRPATASIIYDLLGYEWKDRSWQQKKKAGKQKDNPRLIYEVHLGSFKRHEDGSFLNYRELVQELVDYVADLGYTHIELMPIMEHPYDGSWGYQITGYYAVTSRYGTPEDLMYFVDQCHQRGIGVILDWVPGHFPKDAHGLGRFDGSPLYEHPDVRRGEQPEWGTWIFDYGKKEVQSFLISNLVFWLEYYHVDGFRVDAVASMLYLDYARTNWLPNQYGGRENLEAADFLKRMNETVASLYPNTLMIAEDSSTWPLVTVPTEGGGLGFTHKWNMGWMNDTLRYCSMDPIYRKWHHNLLTFSLTYAFSENFVLPLSHDEVVHGKHSLLDKMPGAYDQKFASLRNLFAYMLSHPGSKLTFMGAEFGQFIEWKYEDKLDWFLLEYEMHRKMKEYVRDLNHFYLNHPCLWENDGSWSGFQWAVVDDMDQSIIALIRRGKQEENYLLVVINFTPVTRPNYRIGIPKEKAFQEVFNSDDTKYGGSGRITNHLIPTEELASHNFDQSIVLSIPPLAAVFYQPVL